MAQVEREPYRVPDIAKKLGVNERTVYNLFGQKKLPGIKVGNNIRFPADEFDRWLSEQLEVNPSDEPLNERAAQ